MSDAREAAKAKLDDIVAMVTAFTIAKSEEEREEVVERMQEYPLDISVRSDWQAPGQRLEPAEYAILLTTGGPAVRIVGDLDTYYQPINARLEYQDWGTPWERYPITSDEEQVLLKFAEQFYYG